jgi:3-phenylpropionate/trans-cinnamate dioxygenase ferredoxin subunit
MTMSGKYNYRNLEDDELEFVSVGTVDEIGNGGRLVVEFDIVQIIVFNIAGKYFAIEDVCSHDDSPLGEGEVDGTQIECPRHGALFDLETGRALTLPAVVDIPAYPVRVEGDEILVGLPLDL